MYYIPDDTTYLPQSPFFFPLARFLRVFLSRNASYSGRQQSVPKRGSFEGELPLGLAHYDRTRSTISTGRSWLESLCVGNGEVGGRFLTGTV